MINRENVFTATAPFLWGIYCDKWDLWVDPELKGNNIIVNHGDCSGIVVANGCNTNIDELCKVWDEMKEYKKNWN